MNSMNEINLFLNSMETEELENLRDSINSQIEVRKKEERKKEYAKAVSNILDEITEIIDECGMGRKIAMTIKKDDYFGVENDIEIDWDDLQVYLEDYLIWRNGGKIG